MFNVFFHIRWKSIAVKSIDLRWKSMIDDRRAMMILVYMVHKYQHNKMESSCDFVYTHTFSPFIFTRTTTGSKCILYLHVMVKPMTALMIHS